MNFDFQLILNSIPLLLQGAAVTIEITAMAVGIGLVLGLITSICRLSHMKALNILAV